MKKFICILTQGSTSVYSFILCNIQETSFSSGLDQNDLGLIFPMDENEEGNCKGNSENAERIMMLEDKEVIILLNILAYLYIYITVY